MLKICLAFWKSEPQYAYKEKHALDKIYGGQNFSSDTTFVADDETFTD